MTEEEYKARRAEFPLEILCLARADPIVNQGVELYAHDRFQTIQQAYAYMVRVLSATLDVTRSNLKEAQLMRPIWIEIPPGTDLTKLPRRV